MNGLFAPVNSALEQLGLHIKTLRKQKGWSQSQLAEMAGLDRTTLGMLERNDYTDIGIRKVQRVLELLGKKLTLANAGLPTLDELVAAQAEEAQRDR
jgi:transcriptional regulator with XRE-family HTH domain